MDDETFDGLALLLSRLTSRRAALGSLGTSGLAAALAGDAFEAAGKKRHRKNRRCKKPKVKCGKKCCPAGSPCFNGKCHCPTGVDACPGASPIDGCCDVDAPKCCGTTCTSLQDQCCPPGSASSVCGIMDRCCPAGSANICDNGFGCN